MCDSDIVFKHAHCLVSKCAGIYVCSHSILYCTTVMVFLALSLISSEVNHVCFLKYNKQCNYVNPTCKG